MYATPGAAPTAPQAEQPTGNSPGKADSETDSSAASGDESWVVLGNQKPAALDAKDALNRPKRWFPFSEGARSCVGQPLANMNVTGTLATLLARFHFTLADQVCPHAQLKLLALRYPSTNKKVTYLQCNMSDTKMLLTTVSWLMHITRSQVYCWLCKIAMASSAKSCNAQQACGALMLTLIDYCAQRQSKVATQTDNVWLCADGGYCRSEGK